MMLVPKDDATAAKTEAEAHREHSPATERRYRYRHHHHPVIFSRLELVNRAAVSQVPRYNSLNAKLAGKVRCSLPLSIKGRFKRSGTENLNTRAISCCGIEPESVDSGAIIITGESAKPAMLARR